MISSILSTLDTDEERKTLAGFYEQYKDQFYYMAYSILHDRIKAEDAIQEAFVRIMKYPRSFFEIEPEQKLPYVNIVIRNAALQMISTPEPQEDELDEELPSTGMSMEEEILGKISKEQLVAFIRTLSEAKRDAVILKGVYGYSYPDIAERLGISESAVRRRIADAYGRIMNFVKNGET